MVFNYTKISLIFFDIQPRLRFTSFAEHNRNARLTLWLICMSESLTGFLCLK